MTEEEARQNDHERSQPNENLESSQTLKNSVEELFASVFRFQDQKEKKTMINEEPRRENDSQQPLQNPTPDPENASENLDTPADNARRQFEVIKEALIGVEPKWVLPKVNPKALESKP